MSVVATTELTRRFGPVTALDRLTVELPAAGVIGLVGPNGSGEVHAHPDPAGPDPADGRQCLGPGLADHAPRRATRRGSASSSRARRSSRACPHGPTWYRLLASGASRSNASMPCSRRSA